MGNICHNIPGQCPRFEATLRQHKSDLIIIGSLNKPVMCKGAVFFYLIIPIKDCIGTLGLVGLFNDSFNFKTGLISPVYSTLDICGLTSSGIKHL